SLTLKPLHQTHEITPPKNDGVCQQSEAAFGRLFLGPYAVREIRISGRLLCLGTFSGPGSPATATENTFGLDISGRWRDIVRAGLTGPVATNMVEP
ncbi:hypothetical protein, partial [Labrys sp. ZIDIC5]|uniref:hypothetical protein n=1 Tax=Labrys sedimenti TaxID=3106036 RepID=UPI002ACA6B80